jgi:hypothetical protein
MLLKSPLAMGRIEDMPHRELVDMNHFFASVNDETRTSSLGINTGRQDSVNDSKTIQRRLVSYKSLFRKYRYSVDLTLVKSEPEVSIQQSKPGVVVKGSWKRLAYYKAILRRCRDAIDPRVRRRKAEDRAQQNLPEVIVQSPWSDYPFLLQEIVNLVLRVDAAASPRQKLSIKPAIDEQVHAIIQAIEEQLDSMPNVERLAVQANCGSIMGVGKALILRSKLGKRMEGRRIEIEVHRIP